MVAVIRSELDNLAEQAAQLETQSQPDAQPGQPAPPAAPPLTNAQCVLMAGQIIRDTMCAVAKVQTPRQTLADATLETVADAIGPVLDKYGLNLASIGGDYMTELRAVLVTVPVILACRSALVDEIKAAKEKPAPAETAPAHDQQAAQ